MLIKAFCFAGGILGAGVYGLARCVILLGVEMEWLAGESKLIPIYWWLGGGVLVGLIAGWTLVRMRRTGS